MHRGWPGMWLAALTLCAAAPTRSRAGPAADGRVESPPLAAARARSAERRWGEAIRELGWILADAPDDARALSELGWAAFQAGDHQQARAALERALHAAARDRRVRAASLYTLGRVEEAAGRRDRAARHYRASLALRRSATVEVRLYALPDERAAPPPLARLEDEPAEPVCAEPRPLQEVCGCVRERFPLAEDREAGECRILEAPRLDRFRVLSLKDDPESSTSLLLLEAVAGGWAVRGAIHTLLSTGPNRLDAVEAAIAGPGGRVLRFTTRGSSHRESLGSRSGWEYRLVVETYCPIGVEGAPTRCALRVPVELYDEQYTFGAHPTRRVEETRLRVDLGDDGIAQVVLVEGVAPEEPAQPELLGPHRLW